MPVQPWIKGNHKRGTPSPRPAPSAFDQRAAQERQAAMAVAAERAVAPPPEPPVVAPIVETISAQDLPWSTSDKKAHLVEVAHNHDLETSGLTKPEIIELLRSI